MVHKLCGAVVFEFNLLIHWSSLMSLVFVSSRLRVLQLQVIAPVWVRVDWLFGLFSAATSHEFSRDLQRFYISQDKNIFVRIPRIVKFLLQNTLKKRKFHKIVVNCKYYDSVSKKCQDGISVFVFKSAYTVLCIVFEFDLLIHWLSLLSLGLCLFEASSLE